MSKVQEILPARKKNSPIKTMFILLVLGLIAFFVYKQVQHYQRVKQLGTILLNNNDSIDFDYHDKNVFQDYLTQRARYNKMAQHLWIDKGLNPKLEDSSFMCADYIEAVGLLKNVQFKERLLKESTILKSFGLNDDDIHIIQERNITPGVLIEAKEKEVFCSLLKGKNVGIGSKAEDIWVVQKLINYHDYNIPVDGIYNSITDSALSDFQLQNGLYRSHKVDDFTLEKLSEDN